MNEIEISQKFHLPLDLLQGLSGEEMSKIAKIIFVLKQAGFSKLETERFLLILVKEPDATNKQVELLTAKRQQILRKIHCREQQIDKIDYLRYKISQKRS